MRTRDRFSAAKRLACLGLAALLLLAPVPAAHAETGTTPAPPSSSAEDLKDLQNRRDEAQKKLDEINAQIKQAKDRADAAASLKAQYQQQQAAIKETIELIKEQIERLEQQIADLEELSRQKAAEIEQKQQEIDARWAGFKERMAAMQMLNDGGSIALLSNVTNMYELLTFPQTMQDIASKDQQVLAELDAEYDELNTLKEAYDAAASQLDATKADCEKQQADLDAKVSELAASIQAQNNKISAAEAEEQAYEESLTEAEKEFENAVAALQNYLAAQNSKYSTPDLYCSLNFGFPIAYYSRISNGFGSYGTNNWRKSAHGGSDLVAPRGTEIYAAADGIVSASHVWQGGKTGNDSYGNYVMILHGTADDGNTYATLYGHMNTAPLVSEGQAVTKGQLIGYVGTTGNSTGYHLHLELRINNVRSDPTRYIPLP